MSPFFLFFAVLLSQSLVQAEAFHSTPQNPCQVMALEAGLVSLNLDARQVSVFDLTQTNSVILIRLTSPHFSAVNNTNQEADLTIGIQNFDGTKCSVGHVQIDFYNDNG